MLSAGCVAAYSWRERAEAMSCRWRPSAWPAAASPQPLLKQLPAYELQPVATQPQALLSAPAPLPSEGPRGIRHAVRRLARRDVPDDLPRVDIDDRDAPLTTQRLEQVAAIRRDRDALWTTTRER